MHEEVWRRGWMLLKCEGFPSHYLDRFLCGRHSALRHGYQQKKLPKCTFRHIQGLPSPVLSLSLMNPFLLLYPWPLTAVIQPHFLVWSTSVCACCFGSRAQLGTTPYRSSHITELRYRTSWWHGYSQGQTLSPISVDQIPCWCRELWFSLHGPTPVDNTCTIQGTGQRRGGQAFGC